MTQINEFRLEALLESLMAKVRPDPSYRDRCDVGYRMVDEAFIIDITTPVSESCSTPLPFVKGVSFDEGVTWRLFEQQESRWEISPQHSAFMSIDELMQTVETLVSETLEQHLSEADGHAV